MQNIEIKQYLIPIFLAAVILIRLEPKTTSYIIAIFPILLISISIYIKNKKIGILGFSLFYLVSLSTLSIHTMEDFTNVMLHALLFLIPGFILLNQILQIENSKIIWFQKEKTKSRFKTIFILILIIAVFYIITIFFSEGILLSNDNTQSQIMLLFTISIFFSTPFFIKK